MKQKKKLDALFSRYIRLKYADDEGLVMCVSCGAEKPIKEMQCGHFVSRSYLAGRFNEENCRPQCAGCNVFKQGNYKEYTLALIDEIGRKKVDELLALKNETRNISKKEYDEMIEHYEAEVKRMQKELGLDLW